MNQVIHSLSQLRKSFNISVKDVAYLADIDPSNLSKIEKGKREVPLRIVLLYHILFEASLPNLFAHQLKELKSLVIERSKELMNQLKADTSPKSRLTIAYFTDVVNSITMQPSC